jgi:hypothetical protein
MTGQSATMVRMDEKRRECRATGFLPDGRDRAIEAMRAEIEAKYADELEKADRVRAEALCKLIEHELEELAERFAPRNGLY